MGEVEGVYLRSGVGREEELGEVMREVAFLKHDAKGNALVSRDREEDELDKSGAVLTSPSSSTLPSQLLNTTANLSKTTCFSFPSNSFPAFLNSSTISFKASTNLFPSISFFSPGYSESSNALIARIVLPSAVRPNALPSSFNDA